MNEKIMIYALLFLNQEIKELELILTGDLPERDRELFKNRKDELVSDRDKIDEELQQ